MVEFHPGCEADGLAQADAEALLGRRARTEVRMLFAFDLKRRAILLVGGDKSRDWKRWYRTNIPVADDRFDEHQTRIAKSEPRMAEPGRAGKRRKKR